jgi:hypothetical protein
MHRPSTHTRDLERETGERMKYLDLVIELLIDWSQQSKSHARFSPYTKQAFNKTRFPCLAFNSQRRMVKPPLFGAKEAADAPIQYIMPGCSTSSAR